MEKKIELEILGLTFTEHAKPTYIIILKEKNGTKRLPIVIGPFEAQAIAIKLDKIIPKRPLTHDLTSNILKAFGIKIIEVTIVKMIEDIFYGEITLEKDGKIIKIDSRPSDAISLALRFNCPIYATESVMKIAGIDIPTIHSKEKDSKEDDKQQHKEKQDLLSKLSVDELKKLMEKAINEENYELASKIRDEIKKRKGET